MNPLVTVKTVGWMTWAVLFAVFFSGITELHASDQPSSADEITIPAYGWLGIEMGEVGGDSTDATETAKGVEVLGVIPDSPAEAAGLQSEDVIVRLNNQPLSSVTNFRKRLTGTPPGRSVTLMIRRQQKTLFVKVTLGKMPPDTAALMLASTITAEGNLAFDKRDFQKALKKYQFAMELIQKHSTDERVIGFAHSDLGKTYLALKDYSAAIMHFPKAAQSFDLAKDYVTAILTKSIIGTIQRDSGQFNEAVKTLKSVLDTLTSLEQTNMGIGDQERIFIGQTKAVTLATLASTYYSLGAVVAQKRTCQQLIGELTEPSIKYNDQRGWVLSGSDHNNLGFCFSLVGEEKQALRQYDLAIRKFQKADNTLETIIQEAWAWKQKAYTYQTLARPEEAIEHYRIAALKYHEASMPLEEAIVLTLLGESYGQIFQFEKAKEYLHAALQIYENEGSLLQQAETLWKIGDISYWSQALAYYDRASAILWGEDYFEQTKILSLQLDTLKVLAELGTEKDWNDIQKAFPESIKNLLLTHEKARSRMTSEELLISSKLQTSGWYRSLYEGGGFSDSNMERGFWQYVIMRLQTNLVDLQRVTKSTDRRLQEYRTHFLLGAAHLKKAEFNLALKHFQIAQTMEDMDRGLGAASLEIYLATTYVNMGDIINALTYYRSALANLELLENKSSFAVAESKVITFDHYIASLKSFVPFLIDLSLHRNDPQYLHEAFNTAERLKARIFLEELAKSRGSPYLPEEKAIRERGNQLQRQIGRLHRLLQTPNLTKTSETELFQELAVLRTQWDTLQEQAKAKNPRYTELISPTPPTVQEVQGELDGKTVVLEYFTTRERITILFAISQDDFQAFQLPTPPMQLVEDYLHTLQQPLVGTEEVARHRALGQELYRHLLGPVQPILDGKQHLIVVPDGRLYYLPFAALILPGDSTTEAQPVALTNVPYLLKDYQVSYFPSVSVMMTQRKHHSANDGLTSLPLLVMGDAIYEEPEAPKPSPAQNIDLGALALRGFTLQRLKYSGEEAQGIATIWGVPLNSPHVNLRERASVHRLRELDLSRYRLLHFATHAIMDDEITLVREPALVLSQTTPDRLASLLKFSDILDLTLNADLVVLSACNTRLGKLHEGEGIVGMTRAFMYAGADSIVVSLWNVEDQSTSLLMQRFHQRLKNGESKAEALRQAKLDILQETVGLEVIGMEQSLASPFFWAPFVLVGDWD